MLFAAYANRLSAIWARGTVAGEDDADALHCAAIASAIPWYVLERIFHLSLLGPSLF